MTNATVSVVVLRAGKVLPTATVIVMLRNSTAPARNNPGRIGILSGPHDRVIPRPEAISVVTLSATLDIASPSGKLMSRRMNAVRFMA